MTPNKVNLYIDGSDFYRGSTRKDLKNGWCDFRALGSILAKRHFGNSFDVGKIWYATNIDAPEIRYGEQRRKKLWLNALIAGVGPVIADVQKPEASLALSVEAVADAVESRLDEDSQHTIVVAADPDLLSPMQSKLSRYRCKVLLAIPPDLSADCERARCGLQVARIAPPDLESSHLSDTIPGMYGRYTWSEYVRSKDESKEVTAYCQEAWEQLGSIFVRVLKPSVIHNSMVPDRVRCSLDAEVEKFLRRPRFDSRLSLACRSFITKNLIDRSLSTHSSSSTVECKVDRINDGDLGRSYLSLFGDYIADARTIRITDPYMRREYQVRNVEELLQIVRDPKGCHVELVTCFDRREPGSQSEVREHLVALRHRLIRRGFDFYYTFDELIHDREIVTEDWRISLGRGLDMYYPSALGQATRRAKACNIFYIKKRAS